MLLLDLPLVITLVGTKLETAQDRLALKILHFTDLNKGVTLFTRQCGKGWKTEVAINRT
jgi:hypothetical protein